MCDSYHISRAPFRQSLWDMVSGRAINMLSFTTRLGDWYARGLTKHLLPLLACMPFSNGILKYPFLDFLHAGCFIF